MKKILFILLITQISIFVYSQHPTWEKVYSPFLGWGNGMLGRDICPADSGNFYVVGTQGAVGRVIYVIKIDSMGNIIWTRSLNDSLTPNTVVSSGDGGCVITGQGYDYTVKFNSNGDIQWSKLYNVPEFSNCYKIIKSSANSYTFCGTANWKALIINIDSIGNFIWEKQFAAPFSMRFNTICNAHTGGYTTAGLLFETDYDPGFGVAYRVDGSGNLIWEKRFSLFGWAVNFKSINAITNGYLLSGDVYDTSISRSRVCIMKIDTSGNSYYIRVIPDIVSNKNFNGDLNIINPNKYLISVIVVDTNYDTASTRIIISDSLGNIIKYSNFKETDLCELDKNYILNENDFLLIGFSNHLPVPDAYVVRTDTNFNYTPYGIKTDRRYIRRKFTLYQNYPNPFNPITKIKFDISEEGWGLISESRLVIYDVLGHLVTILINEKLKPGSYEINWDASNFSSGVYFYQLIVDNYAQTKKLVLLK